MKNVYFCNKSVTYEGVFKKYLKNESERLENYLLVYIGVTKKRIGNKSVSLSSFYK